VHWAGPADVSSPPEAHPAAPNDSLAGWGDHRTVPNRCPGPFTCQPAIPAIYSLRLQPIRDSVSGDSTPLSIAEMIAMLCARDAAGAFEPTSEKNAT
jgi:hypothetical protein